MLRGTKIFSPAKLTLCKTRDKSKAINNLKREAIIIASSGMVTGGRILHHLQQRLPNPNNTILFVGYQAEGTRGRTIVEGNRFVRMHGQDIPINARIEQISGLSAHADYNEILAWLMGFNKPPLKTFIVHGEPEASTSLADKIRKHFGWDVIIPKLGESNELEL